jgi:hypothetical protein
MEEADVASASNPSLVAAPLPALLVRKNFYDPNGQWRYGPHRAAPASAGQKAARLTRPIRRKASAARDIDVARENLVRPTTPGAAGLCGCQQLGAMRDEPSRGYARPRPDKPRPVSAGGRRE